MPQHFRECCCRQSACTAGGRTLGPAQVGCSVQALCAPCGTQKIPATRCLLSRQSITTCSLPPSRCPESPAAPSAALTRYQKRSSTRCCWSGACSGGPSISSTNSADTRTSRPQSSCSGGSGGALPAGCVGCWYCCGCGGCWYCGGCWCCREWCPASTMSSCTGGRAECQWAAGLQGNQVDDARHAFC